MYREPEHVTDRFRRWGIAAWSVIGVLILAATTVWALMQIQEVFPPLVLALVIIFVLNPLVSRLEIRGVPRLAGSCLVYVAFMGLVAVALVFLVPALIHQGQSLARELPETVSRLQEIGRDVGNSISRRTGTRVDIGAWLGSRSELVGELVSRTGGFLSSAVRTLALLVVGVIVGFYLLVDLPRMRRGARRLLPPERREEVAMLAAEVGGAMGGFFRGQLLVALIVGIMSAVALRIVGIPYWLVVGLIAGFFNLVPLIGPYIGAIPGILIALATRPPITMLWVALALTIVQQIDNHFISPNVMRWTVRLHPVTVMLSLTIGAILAGFWGMLVAVPIVASAKVIMGHYWRTRVPWGQDVFSEEDAPDAAGTYPPGDEATEPGRAPPVEPSSALPAPEVPAADDTPVEGPALPRASEA
jgi:predicted PurR-regulated permease PerM